MSAYEVLLGLHLHACPLCYGMWDCAWDCTIEPDLSDQADTGAHAPCPDCEKPMPEPLVFTVPEEQLPLRFEECAP